MYLFYVSFGKVRGSPPSIRQVWVENHLIDSEIWSKICPFLQMKCGIKRKRHLADENVEGQESKVIPNVWFSYTKKWLEKSKCAYILSKCAILTPVVFVCCFHVVCCVTTAVNAHAVYIALQCFYSPFGSCDCCHMCLFRHKCPGKGAVLI